MTIIGLVRHGMTEWNRLGKIQGHTDIPLNEEGRRQARLLGTSLAGQSWDVIGSSDLKRARETAEIIASALGKQVDFTDIRLRERAYGVLEGATFEERVHLRLGGGSGVPAGAESDEEVVSRAEQLLLEMARTHAGKRVLLVSHGGWIVRILKHLFPGAEFGYVHNTSISTIAYEDGVWKPLQLNRLSHLDVDDNS